VDRGENAAWLALQILALSDEDIAAALVEEKSAAVERVKQMDRDVQR